MLTDGRPEVIFAVYAFVVAALIAWLLVPVAARVARRIGAVDEPNERSLHTVPTPRLGGLAILVAVLVAGILFLPLVDLTKAILAGAAVIAFVGMLDDIFDLNPLLKLIGQIIGASIPVFEGVRLGAITVPFVGSLDPSQVDLFTLPLVGGVDLGHVLAIVGIVAIINIINLIDGIDGLAAGVCLIAAVAFVIIAASLDRTSSAVLAALTAGAALGFLRHGFPPASSFMGDSGSNLLGYLLAVVAIQGALKTNAVVALFLPLMVLAVPILDTGFVVAKRIKYKQPIYRADRWHFHHRMANIGFSQRRTLAYLYGWTAVMAGLALAIRFVPYSDNHGSFNPFWTAVIVLCLVLTALASIYLIVTLEILKLRRFRQHQAPTVDPDTVDQGVAKELETGSFEFLDPSTGSVTTVDHETGEMRTI